MIPCFNDMFYKDVDDTERGYEPIDNITVRLVHAWNWDGFMEECVIYGFLKYWEHEGESMLKYYSERKSDLRYRKWMYKGLKICYDRIMNNKETFFGDHVVHSSAFRRKTIEYIWKYRGLMWN